MRGIGLNTGTHAVTTLTLLYMSRAYGWEGLMEEVEMDVKRISDRNLGRDDRQVVSAAIAVNPFSSQ